MDLDSGRYHIRVNKEGYQEWDGNITIASTDVVKIITLEKQSVPSSIKNRRIGQYIDHGNHTVTDTKTGLMWKKCSEGQHGNNCSGEAKKYTRNNAMKHFEQINFAGYNDWRMPTTEELRTLVYCSNGIPQSEAWNNSCSGKNDRGGEYRHPTIHQNTFPNTGVSYWLSSLQKASGARDVNFYNGVDYWDGSSYDGQVRLVRSGQ